VSEAEDIVERCDVEEGKIGWEEKQKQRNIISFNTSPETLNPNP
jgi:hypothetical protein